MSKTISKSLQELIPLLPRNYQIQLAETLSHRESPIPLWRIKKAFSGESQPDEILSEIFSKASELSENHLNKMALVINKTQRLKKVAAKQL